jgi:hypothetical protein
LRPSNVKNRSLFLTGLDMTGGDQDECTMIRGDSHLGREQAACVP